MSPLFAAVRRAALLCLPFAAILVVGITSPTGVSAHYPGGGYPGGSSGSGSYPGGSYPGSPGWAALPRPGNTPASPYRTGHILCILMCPLASDLGYW